MPPDKKTRIRIYLAAWLVALVCTCPVPGALPFIPLFPVGLFFFFTKTGGSNDPSLAAFGWLLYAAHALVFFLTSKRTLYFIAFVIFAILLLTNVVGCRNMLSDSSRIH
jgi:hypothetical protein